MLLNAARKCYLQTTVLLPQLMAGTKRKAVQTSQDVRSALPKNVCSVFMMCIACIALSHFSTC